MANPITEAQHAACQRNAQKSTGPSTAEGKAKSRLNAVKHGLTAKLPVLPFESAADFEALRNGFLQDFAPQNTYQTFLVTQLATQAWRLLRSQQVEIGYQELAMKQILHDLHQQGHSTEKALRENPYAGLALTFQTHNQGETETLRNLFRYLRQIQTDFHRAEKLVKAMKSTTPRSVSPTLPETPAPPPPSPGIDHNTSVHETARPLRHPHPGLVPDCGHLGQAGPTAQSPR